MFIWIGVIVAFIINIFNILEVQELAINKNKYTPYQALLISTIIGFILALTLSIFVDIEIKFHYVFVIYGVFWLFNVLMAFTLISKVHPVSFRLVHNILLPLTILIDVVRGNVDINYTVIIGFMFVFGTVFARLYKERITLKNNIKGKLVYLLPLGLIINAYTKVLRYEIRTEYNIDTLSFIIINGLIAIPLYIIFLILIKEINIKSIVSNKGSHFRAGSYSAIQQVLSIFVAGYIPASYIALLRSITGYLTVHISKRSKDKEIREVDSKAYLYFIFNFIGTCLIVLN